MDFFKKNSNLKSISNKIINNKKISTIFDRKKQNKDEIEIKFQIYKLFHIKIITKRIRTKSEEKNKLKGCLKTCRVKCGN